MRKNYIIPRRLPVTTKELLIAFRDTMVFLCFIAVMYGALVLACVAMHGLKCGC